LKFEVPLQQKLDSQHQTRLNLKDHVLACGSLTYLHSSTSPTPNTVMNTSVYALIIAVVQ